MALSLSAALSKSMIGAAKELAVALVTTVENMVPVPSSLMVAVPTVPVPVVGVAAILRAVRVKVSPAAVSKRMSLVIATRTNKLAASACVASPSPGIWT